MIIYSQTLDQKDFNCLFSLERDQENLHSYYVRDEIVLDLTCEANIEFYEQEGDNLGILISSWMKENPTRAFSWDLANELKGFAKVIAFRDKVIVFDRSNIVRKPSIEEFSSIKVEVKHPEEMVSSFGNQDMTRFPYASSLWSDVSDFKRFKFLCFITASIDGYLVGVSKVMEAMESTNEQSLLASSYVSVDEEWRGLGVGRMLKEKTFELAAQLKTGLKATDYSAMGRERLKELNYELSKKYKVPFSDNDMRRIQEQEEFLGRKMTTEELDLFFKRD